jgi:hypothetical protein
MKEKNIFEKVCNSLVDFLDVCYIFSHYSIINFLRHYLFDGDGGPLANMN